MWISRTHYDTLVENLTRERAENVVLKTENARLHAMHEALLSRVDNLQDEATITSANTQALNAALGDTISLKAQLAAKTSTEEWLMFHVNRLEAEREILTRERLHVSFPRPEIAREPSTAKPSREVSPDATPGLDPDSVHGTPDDSIGFVQTLSAALEDVGDEMAGRLGIVHDDAGNAIFKN